MLKLFLAGWAILVVAVILNILASRLGLSTWYEFLTQVSKEGFSTSFFKLAFFSQLFLFIFYPFLLGLAAYLAFKIK